MTQDPTRPAKVFHNMSHAVMVTDSEGAIVSVNAAYRRVTGWRPEEVRGQSLQDLAATGQQAADATEAMWNALLTQGHWQGELWHRRKTGESHPEFLTVDALPAEDGATSGFVAVFSDPGERAQNETRQSYFAFHDALTELPNQTLFHDRHERAVLIARNPSRSTTWTPICPPLRRATETARSRRSWNRVWLGSSVSASWKAR